MRKDLVRLLRTAVPEAMPDDGSPIQPPYDYDGMPQHLRRLFEKLNVPLQRFTPDAVDLDGGVTP